ncbi:hypothetical protein Tco_0489677 [Tanacetum coccineum]
MDKIDELQNELLQMIQSFCENFLQQKAGAIIDQSSSRNESSKKMGNLIAHYIDELLRLSLNPPSYLNDDFTSSDDESLSDEDVPEDNFKIYLNPLFELDDEYISSDSRTFLVTPLSVSKEDECFTPSDDVELLLHRDSSTPMISVVSILEGFTDEPPLEENDDLFDLESKGNEWKKIFVKMLPL